jgi:phage shock protein PspC (stress-responsive transcriptional regulator)
MEKRLYRSRDDRMIWGVCGGIAKYFGIDPTIIRVIAILLLFAGGAAIPAYIILAIVIPLESSPSREPKDVIKENVEEIKQTATQLGDDIRSTFASQEGTPEEAARRGQRSRNFLGLVLIIVGAVFLLVAFKPFWWFDWYYLWPALLIALGLIIIFGTRRR